MHINTQILIAIYPQIIHVHLKSSFLSVFRSSQMATLPTSTIWWSLGLCAPPPAMPACFCASPASGCQPTQRAKRPPSAPRPTLAPAAPRVASSCGSLTRRRDPPRSSCRTCQSGRRTVTAAARPGPEASRPRCRRTLAPKPPLCERASGGCRLPGSAGSAGQMLCTIILQTTPVAAPGSGSGDPVKGIVALLEYAQNVQTDRRCHFTAILWMLSTNAGVSRHPRQMATVLMITQRQIAVVLMITQKDRCSLVDPAETDGCSLVYSLDRWL